MTFKDLSDKALSERLKHTQCQILSSPNTNLFQSLIRNQVNTNSSVILRLSTPVQPILSSIPFERVHCHYSHRLPFISPSDCNHCAFSTSTGASPTSSHRLFLDVSLQSESSKAQTSLESTAVNFLLFSYFLTIFCLLRPITVKV